MNMLAKKAKKGFTIVELVIVIAVIAILAAVLIPTFTSVITNANKSSAMQESKNEWTNYLSEVAGEGNYTKYTYYVVYNDGDYVFVVSGGEFDTEPAYTDQTGYATNYSSFDVSDTTLDGYTYTSGSDTKVRIYNMSAAAAAAAAEAATASGLTTSSTYYAKVVVNGTTYWLEGTASDATKITVTSALSAAPSDASSTEITTTAGSGYSDYTVTFYAVS